MRHPLLAVALLMCSALPAHAQDASSLSERLDRLERDVTFVQKQVYRNGTSGGEGSGGAAMNSGQLQVRFSQIDEEMRQIRGLIEQTQFQNKQIANDLKRLSDDVDFRLRAIEQKQAAADAVPSPAASSALPPAGEPVADPAAAANDTQTPATYKPEPKTKPVEKPAVTGKDFPDANAHYSHAFKLLNEKKFAEAATSFDGFVKKYPADPLTANAFYWLGESQYARSDFTRSTESFRKGFEVNPDGQKAPDNLYKLALSLAQIKRKTEACVVLSQVISKYGATAARTAAKASEARTTFECK